MPYIENNTFFTGGMIPAGHAPAPRRPTSWPMAFVKPELMDQALPVSQFAASVSTLDAPVTAPADVPLRGMVMLCDDAAGEDADMWDLLVGHPGSAQPCANPYERAAPRAMPLGSQPHPSIRVLGENQSLQALWDNLQPQPDSLLDGHATTGGAAAGMLDSTTIFDTNVSMTTMMETEQPNVKYDALDTLPGAHAPAVNLLGMRASTPTLGPFCGFGTV